MHPRSRQKTKQGVNQALVTSEPNFLMERPLLSTQLTVLVMSGGGASLTGTWRHQVVPTGTRLVAVRVASPRDGDRVAALLTAWSCLYATTLPLLQALLAPVTVRSR